MLTAATLLSGCGIEGYRIEVSEDTESSDDDSFDDESFDDDESSDDEPSNDDEFSDSAESFGSTESSSVLEGVWYAFDIVKRNEDTPQKVVFEQSMVFNEDPVQPSKKYQYDEGGQMLEVDYTEYIDPESVNFVTNCFPNIAYFRCLLLVFIVQNCVPNGWKNNAVS